MIQEIVMYTEKTDIPNGYLYDTETPDFYVYRHEYTGKEIHIAKIPPLYVNVKDYTNEVLDKIRAEIKNKIIKKPNLDFKIRERERNDAFLEVLDILDKYKAESEE